MNKNVEVLAPAGSYESLVAAVNARADAVYLGGELFGARAYASNFNEEALIKGIHYAHYYGVKVYLTINTLFRNDELDKLYEYLLPFYVAGLDAVIVQDLGVLRFVKRQFPDLDIHASTQMSTSGAYGAAFLKEQGATRIVTARELSLGEIEAIHKNVDIEIEAFVHGAMCYSFSGQCLMSSFIGGRSGNRGRCAQSCRLPYTFDNKTSYILSLKDMCTLDILPDICDAGVYSLKIEGRMKSPEYTAFVTSVYRKYADMYLENGRDNYKVDADDLLDLMDLFNRGSFSTGYYTMHNGKNMLSDKKPGHQGVNIGSVIKREGNIVSVKLIQDVNAADILYIDDKYDYTLKESQKKNSILKLNVAKNSKIKVHDNIFRIKNSSLIDEIKKNFIDNNLKISLDAQVYVNEGAPICINCMSDGEMITVTSEYIPQKAENKPVSEEDIRKQLKKTGNTFYEFKNIDVYIEGQPFIPVKILNDMRRELIENVMKNSEAKNSRNEVTRITKLAIKASKTQSDRRLSVYIEDVSMLEKVICYDIDRVYIEASGIDNSKLIETNEKLSDCSIEMYLALPYIFRKADEELLKAKLLAAKEAKVAGLLVRNLEEYAFLCEIGFDLPVIFDYNVYIYNDEASEWLNGLGETTCGVELNYSQLKQMNCENSELIVFGHIPVMTSAGCIVKNTSGCKKQSTYTTITDRVGEHFDIKNECAYCYNIMYNSKPLMIADKEDEIRSINPAGVRVMFRKKDEAYIAKVMSDIASNDNSLKDYTRGHFMRGIL